MTTMGKYHHLTRCGTEAGHFVVLAIDHRAILLDALNKHAPQPLTDAGFTDFKRDVTRQLLPESTATLTDPAYGIGPAIAGRYLHGGLLAPIEVTDYDLHPSQRAVNFIPGWSVARIKRVGGDGVKLLLPYHPDDSTAADKRKLVDAIIADCTLHDIPFFLEPIAYSLDPDNKLDNAELRRVSVTMARQFAEAGVDVLKLAFPLDAKLSMDEAEWADACAEVDAACGDVPWALLSAGVSYEVFARQARVACAAGASGVIVGRAVWTEAVALQGAERASFIATTARERMRELAAICAEHARPWHSRVAAPDAALNWYESYSE